MFLTLGACGWTVIEILGQRAPHALQTARSTRCATRVSNRAYRVDEAISLPPPTIAPGLAPPMTEVGISMGAIS